MIFCCFWHSGYEKKKNTHRLLQWGNPFSSPQDNSLGHPACSWPLPTPGQCVITLLSKYTQPALLWNPPIPQWSDTPYLHEQGFIPTFHFIFPLPLGPLLESKFIIAELLLLHIQFQRKTTSGDFVSLDILFDNKRHRSNQTRVFSLWRHAPRVTCQFGFIALVPLRERNKIRTGRPRRLPLKNLPHEVEMCSTIRGFFKMGLFSGFLIHNLSGSIHFNDELDENIQL